MSTTSSLGTVGKNAFYYTIGSVVSRAASLILLPIYTRYLTPADYGVMELIGIAVDVAAILFVAGMNSGMQRFFFAEESAAARDRVVSTTFWLEVGLGFVAAAVLFAAAPLAPIIGLRKPEHVGFIHIAAATFFFGVLSSVPMLLLQTLNRARTFVVVSIAKLVAQISLHLYFLVHLQLGVIGVLYTGLIVNLVLGIVLALWMARTVGVAVSRSDVSRLRAFGVPYQITVAGSFILVFGDRFVLGSMTTTAQVGLYGLAYQFGFLLSSLTEVPFMRAWNPIRYSLVREDAPVRDAAYNDGLRAISVLLTVISVGVILFSPLVLTLMAAPEFHEAARLVPVIAAAYVVQCYTTVVLFGIDVSTQTKYYTIATWSAAAVSMVLYVLLIPPFGGTGAAWATLVAFLVRFSITYYHSQSLWPIRYEWASTIRAGGIILVVAAAQLSYPATSALGELAFGLVGFNASGAALWFLALRHSERARVKAFLLRVVSGREPRWPVRAS